MLSFTHCQTKQTYRRVLRKHNPQVVVVQLGPQILRNDSPLSGNRRNGFGRHCLRPCLQNKHELGASSCPAFGFRLGLGQLRLPCLAGGARVQSAERGGSVKVFLDFCRVVLNSRQRYDACGKHSWGVSWLLSSLWHFCKSRACASAPRWVAFALPFGIGKKWGQETNREREKIGHRRTQMLPVLKESQAKSQSQSQSQSQR